MTDEEFTTTDEELRTGVPRTTFWSAKDEAILDRLWNRPHTDIETVSGRAIFDKAKASRTQELTITAQALRVAITAIEIEAETRVINRLRKALRDAV